VARQQPSGRSVGLVSPCDDFFVLLVEAAGSETSSRLACLPYHARVIDRSMASEGICPRSHAGQAESWRGNSPRVGRLAWSHLATTFSCSLLPYPAEAAGSETSSRLACLPYHARVIDRSMASEGPSGSKYHPPRLSGAIVTPRTSQSQPPRIAEEALHACPFEGSGEC
jgi:hypothetical protein